MIKTKLILARFGKDGQLIEQREQESRSWLKHLIDFFYVLHVNTLALAAVNDITGTPRTLSDISNTCWGHLQVSSAPGGASMGGGASVSCPPPGTSLGGENVGIVVGTGAGAVTPTQDALQAKVAHGEAAGQLLHGGTELYGLTFVNPNGQFSIRRYFTNILGGVITIQEVGIYAVGVVGATGPGYAFCIARDVVAPGITVNNGEILEATYTPQITV